MYTLCIMQNAWLSVENLTQIIKDSCALVWKIFDLRKKIATVIGIYQILFSWISDSIHQIPLRGKLQSEPVSNQITTRYLLHNINPTVTNS
jgi:hypothetical protein